MTRFKSEQSEKDAVRMAAELMAASARTAPKTRGVESMETIIIDGDDLEELAAAMEKKGSQKSPTASPSFYRDAANVRNSGCVLLIGVRGEPKKIETPLNCGGCGYESCAMLAKARGQTTAGKKPRDFSGPICIFQAMDLGIALGSAVKLAAQLSVDNRIMYTIGNAAKMLGWLDADIIIGIPLSATGKSIYFDRQAQPH